MSTSTTSRPRTDVNAWSPARRFAALSAAVYLGAGVIGFLVTGFDDVTGLTDERILILAVNPLHNLVHLTLGAVYAVGAVAEDRAAAVNLAIGVGLLAAFVLGVAGGANFLNIDGVAEPDNWLHLTWGLASIGLGRTALSLRS